jgi:hypothetical protein
MVPNRGLSAARRPCRIRCAVADRVFPGRCAHPIEGTIVRVKARARSRPAAQHRTGAADPETALPDARDGLTRLERVILLELSRIQAERDGASVSTAMLYGRVVEQINISVEEFQSVLSRLAGR